MFEWLGIRAAGFIPALILPLVLTMVHATLFMLLFLLIVLELICFYSKVSNVNVYGMQVLFMGPLFLHYLDGIFQVYQGLQRNV